MAGLEQSVLASLDGRDPRLFPFLPELLQDLDNLGADPALIEDLLIKHGKLPARACILDLGCGKGSVSLHLLQHHPWDALGLDGLPAFVETARKRASALNLADRCRFDVADIRAWPGEGTFDALILGAIGPVLGATAATLRHIAPWLAPCGVIVIDETYAREGVDCRNPAYGQGREELLEAIHRSGFHVVAEGSRDAVEQEAENKRMFKAISTRARRLARRHPDLKELFEGYLESQSSEIDILEHDVVDVTLLLRSV